MNKDHVCHVPAADTNENCQKLMRVMAMDMLSRLYGTSGDNRSSSTSFHPSNSMALSITSHRFDLPLASVTMQSRSMYRPKRKANA